MGLLEMSNRAGLPSRAGGSPCGTSSPEMTIERLQAFDDAWRQKDLEALMKFMADDCEYHASVGPDPGESFIGKEAVRRGCQEPGYGDPRVVGQSDPPMFGYGDPRMFGLSDPPMCGLK